MLPEYRTIYQGGEDEIVEKKSRFIATVIPVENEEEALEFIEKTKKKYWDARHNCFAYVIGERGQLQRCSDDGEPNGTAGKPMLDVLLGNELRNVAVVVTRLFRRYTAWYRRAGSGLFTSCESRSAGIGRDNEDFGCETSYRDRLYNIR